MDAASEPRLEHRTGWRVAEPAHRCSFPHCRRAAILLLIRNRARGAPRGARYYYCDHHTYGRVVRDGAVWWDPRAAEAIRAREG